MYISSTWQDQILSLRSLQSANTHICFPYGWIPTLITASEAIVSLLRLDGTRPDQRRCITPACLNSNCSTWPTDEQIRQTCYTKYYKSSTSKALITCFSTCTCSSQGLWWVLKHYTIKLAKSINRSLSWKPFDKSMLLINLDCALNINSLMYCIP